MENRKVTYTYIEVRRDRGDKVVKRIDVSGQRNKYIETVEDGLNRNLNYLKYSTFIVHSETELKEI